MVDVEQRTLRPLEHDAFAFPAQAMQHAGDIVHQWCDLFTLRQGLIQHLLVIDGSRTEVMLQGMVVIFHNLAQPLGEMRGIKQLSQSQATA